MCNLCVCHVLYAHQGQKRVLDPLEFELCVIELNLGSLESRQELVTAEL